MEPPENALTHSNNAPSPLADALLAQARQFSTPLLQDQVLDGSGEPVLAHTQGMLSILQSINIDAKTQAAVLLLYTCGHLQNPEKTLEKIFDTDLAQLSVQAHRLMQLQHQAQLPVLKKNTQPLAAQQVENIRKMLLAFSRDIRVVILRLASRLQSLRFAAQNKLPLNPVFAQESLQVFAPLANRLGFGQIKWEMEDLSFRFLDPDTYQDIAAKLQHKRRQREGQIQALQNSVESGLKQVGLKAQVQGRAKHIYSIVKKMRGKNLPFERIMDIFALRILVTKEADCYTALAWLHQHFQPVEGEFDDYIAKPKSNGYQSIHTVVWDSNHYPVEVQIRSHDMHQHAELGVAAHWAYKEAGSKGYAGVNAADGEYERKIMLLRQLLDWERELTQTNLKGLFDDRIYVFTPQANLVELPQGATPIDLAYAVHTSLGHRCRGAKIDGNLVALSTKLKNGQMVEILPAKEGGPSRDWLNSELGFLVSARARAKVRAWFNAQQLEETQANGREWLERLLQREGKTSVNLENLAQALGCRNMQHLFEQAGKDAFAVQQIEHALLSLAPPSKTKKEDAQDTQEQMQTLAVKGASKVSKRTLEGHSADKHTILVQGVDSLMNRLAQCCKPVPPDALGGFISRGKGISVHRRDCSNFRHLLKLAPERTISVTWGGTEDAQDKGSTSYYPMDIRIYARNRDHLLRDISDAFAKEQVQVRGGQMHSEGQYRALFRFTVIVSKVQEFEKIAKHLQQIKDILGVERV